jgi:hypothetical protein
MLKQKEIRKVYVPFLSFLFSFRFFFFFQQTELYSIETTKQSTHSNQTKPARPNRRRELFDFFFETQVLFQEDPRNKTKKPEPELAGGLRSFFCMPVNQGHHSLYIVWTRLFLN